MRAFWWIAGLALGALLVYLLSNLIPAAGGFARLEQRLVDHCQRLDVFHGAEDVAIDQDTGLAFVSAADRRSTFLGRPAPRGGIYVFDIRDPEAARLVSPEAPADFQPHGISLWRGAGGAKRLFVVNHPLAGGHTVEIFSVGADGALDHLETVAFEEMHSPNDVVAVGPRQFYATNDRGFTGGLLATLEAYLALPFSSVVFYDGEEGRFAARGLVYANGINVSHDGSTIYVAELLRRRINLYERDAASGALSLERRIRVRTAPDNIDVARDGALWIAGHTKIFDFLKHAEDASAVAPSHVIRVDPVSGAAQDMFVDKNGVINAASVGAFLDNILVVGAVFDGHVMVCPMMQIFLDSAADYDGGQ